MGTRAFSQVITSEGSNLSIVESKTKYQRRKVEGGGYALLYVSEVPTYFPKVNQRIVIHHSDIQSGSPLETYLGDMSSNTATAVYVGFINLTTLLPNVSTTVPATTTEPTGDVSLSSIPTPIAETTPAASTTTFNPLSARDGFTYAIRVKYDDNILGNSAGNCNGLMEYFVSPDNYDILKPVTSNIIVTERVTYDGDDGDNYLIGTSSSSGQTTENVAPMLFVGRLDSNTVFSNLYKTFNLPVTDEEIAEYEQTDLGTWTNDTTGTLYWNGQKGIWTADPVSGTMIHPVTGYTGMFHSTVYSNLNQEDVLIMEIPQGQYGEIVDGKSLKIKLPSTGGTFYEIYGAYIYNDTQYEANKMNDYYSEHDFSASYFGNPVYTSSDIAAYESNIVLLFCDDIATPVLDPSGSWATGHDEVMSGEKVYTTNASTKKSFADYYQDKCVGIAYLDKGFVVITDQVIYADVYSQYYDSGSYGNIEIASNIIVNYENDGITIDRDSSQFLFSSSYVTGATDFFAEYLSYNMEKSMNVVCLAGADEFYRTTNSTAKVLMGAEDDDYADFKNTTVSGQIYPIIITEIGLHDASGNLLAIVKPTEPIKKNYYEPVSFTVRIRL